MTSIYHYETFVTTSIFAGNGRKRYHLYSTHNKLPEMTTRFDKNMSHIFLFMELEFYITVSIPTMHFTGCTIYKIMVKFLRIKKRL